MGDTNVLMDFVSASLGATLDEISGWLIVTLHEKTRDWGCLWSRSSALGREGRGNRATEIMLMLAFGESGTAERGRNRLMRWRRGEISGHDLTREPGLGEQRDYQLTEMLLTVRPVQALIGAK